MHIVKCKAENFKVHNWILTFLLLVVSEDSV
jgi:hypothetical protein